MLLKKDLKEMLNLEQIQAQYGIAPSAVKKAIRGGLVSHRVGQVLFLERKVLLAWIKSQPSPWEKDRREARV
jgi:hypothetical protein